MTTEAASPPAIQTRALTKRFGRVTAVDGIDLVVPTGSIFGFLGPNGSGKTTTIRMLLGLITPSSGSIRMLGRTLPEGLATVLPRVGALVEGPAFYPFLSGRANLRRFDTAGRHGSAADRADRVASALQRVGLSAVAESKVRGYSLGMRQRLGIAAALLRPRSLIVLDEPTNGLDPQGTREVRSLIRSLADDGATVVVSSHLLTEIEQLCSHAAVLRAGRLVAQGPLDEIGTGHGGRLRITVRRADTAAAMRTLEGCGLVFSAVGPDTVPEEVVLEGGIDEQTNSVEQLVAALVRAGVGVRGVVRAGGGLEERFVALTGEGFDVGA